VCVFHCLFFYVCAHQHGWFKITFVQLFPKNQWWENSADALESSGGRKRKFTVNKSLNFLLFPVAFQVIYLLVFLLKEHILCTLAPFPMVDEWQGQLSHIHALGQLTHIPATTANSTVLPGQDSGPILLSATIDERWTELSRALRWVRSTISYAQPLDIHSAMSRDIQMFFSSNISHGHWHWILRLHSHGLRHDPQWQIEMDLTMDPGVMAGHSQRGYSYLESPILSLFIIFELFHISFSPIWPPQTYMLW